MSKKSFLFVANWKMGLTGQQTMQYIHEHGADMERLMEHTGHQIVICPSFPMLSALCDLMRGAKVQLGAQTCSAFDSGPYTGEVSAELLAALGCRYCIVGHSERRRYCHETDDDIARKVRMCLLAGMQPIVCVGEMDDAKDVRRAASIIEKQLVLLRDYTADIASEKGRSIWIAYEPVWAIGTGKIADPIYVSQIYEVLAHSVAQYVPRQYEVHYMYGGSVNENTIQAMLTVQAIDGFLSGGASLDFQKFRDMISLSV